MLVDSAVYVDGHSTTPATLGEACRVCREPGKFAWVTLHEPGREEFVSAAGEFGLDEMAVEDAIEPHQRPKIEHIGERLFVVLKSALPGGCGQDRVRRDTRLRRAGLHRHGFIRQ